MFSLRNIAAFLTGIALGAGVNMALVILGPMVVPLPAGVDMTSVEGMSASMHLLRPIHFLFPFLAHGIGTLVGALAAFVIARSHRALLAYVIGVFFLAGGISASYMIPAPVWFVALDLVGAYLPMAWLATVLGNRITRGNAEVGS